MTISAQCIIELNEIQYIIRGSLVLSVFNKVYDWFLLLKIYNSLNSCDLYSMFPQHIVHLPKLKSYLITEVIFILSYLMPPKFLTV